MSSQPEILLRLPSGPASWWLSISKYGIVFAIALFYVTVVLHFDYTPDDTYIYLQYAKNLSDGNGFSFNSGAPSYGATGPLWVLLITFGRVIGLDPYIVAKTLDLFFASLTIFLFFYVALLLIKDRIYAFFALLLLTFDTWFLRWSSSGMETSLSVLLCLLAIWYALRNEYLIASIVTGLLTLVRPEGGLLFVVVIVDNFLNTTRIKPALKDSLRSLTMYALVVVPWLVFAALYFGVPLPNTYIAKSGAIPNVEETLDSLITMAGIVGSTQVLIAVILVLGTGLAVKKIGLKNIRTEIIGLIWILALPIFYALANVQVVSRYMLMITPFVILYGFWGLKKIEELLNVRPAQILIILVLVSFVTLAQNRFVYHSQAVPHMNSFTNGMNDALKPIAYWLKEHTTTDAEVLAPDIGLIGYISDRTIYDVAGLVTPKVRMTFAGKSYDDGMAQRCYEKVVNPDYVIHRSTNREILASEDMVPVMTREFFGLGIRKKETQYVTLYKSLR